MVISKAVVSYHMSRTQTDLAQNMFTVDALVGDVVKSEADARVAHAKVLIGFVKEYGHERGLPVMTMDDVGMLVRLKHEFQRGAGEESESFDIVMMAVKNAAIEKVVVGVRIDEETSQAFHEPEVNVAMNPLVVVGDPKIAVGFGQTPDAVVAHAIIFGQDDFDRVATNAKFSGQALDDVTEAADFRGGSAFGRDHYDEHGAEEVI